MSIIDAHAHFLTRDFLKNLARESKFGIESDGPTFRLRGYGPLDPLLFDLEARINDLNAVDIELQLIFPPPRVVSTPDWTADVDFARQLNRQTSDAVRAAGGRMAGLAVPPLAEPQVVVAEISRAMDEDGLVGVTLPTSAAQRPLDDPAFEPMFKECARRNCVVFLHPTTAFDRPQFGQYTMLQLVGWPTETALCAARLIFAGTIERHNGLKLILAHGGGTLPILAGRMDLAYGASNYEANPDCRKHITREPSTYFKDLYYDTVVSHPKAIRFLIDLVGPDRVIFGSDAPFEIGDARGSIARDALRDAPRSIVANVMGGTLRRLLDHGAA